MAGNSPKAEKEVFVKVNFTETAVEYRFFNAYEVRRTGSFIFLRLAYVGPEIQGPIFSGAISDQDAKQLIPSFKSYVPKLAASSPKDDVAPFPAFHHSIATISTPIAFQHVGLVFQGEMGELTIGQFSHKDAASAASKKPKDGKPADSPSIKGTLFGIYTSPTSVHRNLVLDFIKTCERK